MWRRIVFSGLMLVLVLPCLSFAPAATDLQPDLKALAQVRYQSARDAFDESWLMYKRKIQPEGVVYVFSHRLMLSQLDCAETITERVAACQGHLERMKKMQAMVIKLRDLGFSKKFEVKELEYFVNEARYWHAREAQRLGDVILELRSQPSAAREYVDLALAGGTSAL
jgi:hypothetical protein